MRKAHEVLRLLDTRCREWANCSLCPPLHASKRHTIDGQVKMTSLHGTVASETVIFADLSETTPRKPAASAVRIMVPYLRVWISSVGQELALDENQAVPLLLF